MKQRAHQFIKYVNKVYGLSQQLFGFSDGRTNPQVSLQKILMMIFFSLAVNVHSFNMMEGLLKQGYFNKVLKKRRVKGSADTFGYALARSSIKQFERFNRRIIKTARYNKVFQHGTIDGFTVVALDGTEAFRTQCKSWSCEKCRTTKRTDGKPGKEVDYHENLVGAAYVGRSPNLTIGLERIAPGEGEQTASLRLLRKLYQDHFRYADAITLDSLYAKAPVINEIVAQNKIAVIRVKQENYNIIKDADGIFAGREPDLEKELSLKSSWYEDDQSGEKYTYEVKIWDAENFESWPGVKVPLRVLRIQETRLCGSQKEKGEQITTHMVTTADKVTLPTESAWRILHRRWDIENKVFHDLKTNWGFGHNHHHDEVTFMAMRWLIVITRNLFFLFYYRRLPRSYRKRFSKKVLMFALSIGLIDLEPSIWQPEGG